MTADERAELEQLSEYIDAFNAALDRMLDALDRFDLEAKNNREQVTS